ncbi:MAG: FAD synthetase family protein [Treponema sp.]|jgi:riboflavin kinase/FMN adenylyltransferase|nr:FAD synthetase family protein [Treponema sp.]
MDMSMRVIDWKEYISPSPTPYSPLPLALTIGVFDGVHKGHQSLIQRICASPHIPTVVTFKENPVKTLKPDAFTGDIINLEQKLSFLEAWGVQLTVLIDFSPKFSKISGRDFVDLLLGGQAVKLIALGRNFRCGHQLDTGAEEIQGLAGARGVEVWIAPPVMDEGQPVSSSRIRQALAAGRRAEAERLLGWPLESIKPNSCTQ